MPAFNLFNQFAIDDLLRYGIALIVVASGIIAIGYSIWGGLLLITS